MVHVEIFKYDDGSIGGFESRGHAGFADKGKDIICAAVSMTVINTINSIDELLPEDGRKMEVLSEEEKGILRCTFKEKPSKEAELLLRSMYLGLKTIRKEYGKKYLELLDTGLKA